jgi:hypothetical protein
VLVGLQPELWETFALGHLGASAALLGLVFVGISINLREVLAQTALVNRAGEAVALLASLLIGSTAILIPGQSSTTVGIELLAIGALTVAGVASLQRDMGTEDAGDDTATPDPGPANGIPRSSAVARRILGLGAGTLVAIAGLSLVVDSGGGMYWWAAGVVVVYLGAITNAWVLMIEILR